MMYLFRLYFTRFPKGQALASLVVALTRSSNSWIDEIIRIMSCILDTFLMTAVCAFLCPIRVSQLDLHTNNLSVIPCIDNFACSDSTDIRHVDETLDSCLFQTR